MAPNGLRSWRKRVDLPRAGRTAASSALAQADTDSRTRARLVMPICWLIWHEHALYGGEQLMPWHVLGR